MPLLRAGRLARCDRRFVGDDDPVEDWGTVIISPSRLLRDFAAAPGAAGLAVRMAPPDRVEAVAPYLSAIVLIEVEFPKYTDGRGYSTAQLLRRRYGFMGELRAVGDVLRDQLAHMDRSGFDSMTVAFSDAEATHEAAVSELSLVYQPAADDRLSVFQLRARSANGDGRDG
jgi:uncharacterized protein (DUF934 family)